MTEANIGYGATFEIANSSSSPTSFLSVGEITSITPPNQSVDMIDVTHMQSPSRRREFISGLIDNGECAVEMNFVPGSAGDTELMEILDLPISSARSRNCRIRFSNGVTHTFLAELQGYERTIPVDDKMTATVTFKVTGVVTRGVIT